LSSGFTLIEVLIVVAILGILMSIAVPAYNEYVRRAHRAAAQQFLLDVAQRQEQYLLDNRQYATILGAGAGGLDMVVPADISPYYNNGPDFTGVNNAATPPAFLLFMSPKAGKMSGTVTW
jgi:type IV pilus assembly protein PilE